MAPQQTQSLGPVDSLGAQTNEAYRKRALSWNAALSTLDAHKEKASSKSDGARSVLSSLSQRSRLSSKSLSALKSIAKIGSTHAPVDSNEGDQAKRCTAPFPSEKSAKKSLLIQIHPKILGGIVCEHTYEEKGGMISNAKKSDSGYIRLLKPKTTDMVKSRPLLDTPFRVDSEEQGVEVVQKSKFIVWDEPVALELLLPIATQGSDKREHDVVMEVGIIEKDVICPLGSARICIKEDDPDKTRFLLSPKPIQEQARKSVFSRRSEDPVSKYRLDSDTAFAVEVDLFSDERNMARRTLTQKRSGQQTESPLNAKALINGLAARFGANMPKSTMFATGAVEEKNSSTSPPRSATSNVAKEPDFVNIGPFGLSTDAKDKNSPKSVPHDVHINESFSKDIDQNTLPFVEMTSFSAESKSTANSVKIEANRCMLFVDSVESEYGSHSANEPSETSTETEHSSTSSDSSSSADVCVEDEELATIMKKRERLIPRKIGNATTNISTPVMRSFEDGALSLKQAPRKKSMKDKLKRILEFDYRGAARRTIISRNLVQDQGESACNSILDAGLNANSSLKQTHCTSRSNSRDFGTGTCCSPFQKGGALAHCSSYLKITPEQDVIQLSQQKVSQLAKSLKMTPSTLVKKIEQLDE